MKYLKEYWFFGGEPIPSDGSNVDLQEFCELQLVYLIDDGYSISVYEFNESTIISIMKGKDYPLFNWDDIKDTMIPFINRLSKIVEINNIKFNGKIGTGEQISFSLEEIISDNLYGKEFNSSYKNSKGWFSGDITAIVIFTEPQ